MELVTFTLIVDDMVFPDGTTRMAQLGGGGAQTLFGFQLANAQPARVGLAAGVGHDLPDDCREWLSCIGCDLNGLIVHPALQTPRAWQILEDDGRRTEVWRTMDSGWRAKQLLPDLTELPPAYQNSRFYHLCIHAGQPPMQLLESLQAAAHANGGLLSVETFRCCDAPPSQQQLQALLALCDIFSPNEAEAASIVPGPGGARGLVSRLLAAGASTVALRRGPKGAIVAQRGSGEAWTVPAIADLDLVDVTGCGNAFCGGLLAALAQGQGLRDAGVWGCVAGSIMAEWRGVPQVTPQLLRGRALQRVEPLGPLARRISIRGCSAASNSVSLWPVPAVARCPGRAATAGMRHAGRSIMRHSGTDKHAHGAAESGRGLN